MDKEEIDSRFGFLVEALKYTPPHGGIAFDRLIESKFVMLSPFQKPHRHLP